MLSCVCVCVCAKRFFSQWCFVRIVLGDCSTGTVYLLQGEATSRAGSGKGVLLLRRAYLRWGKEPTALPFIILPPVTPLAEVEMASQKTFLFQFNVWFDWCFQNTFFEHFSAERRWSTRLEVDDSPSFPIFSLDVRTVFFFIMFHFHPICSLQIQEYFASLNIHIWEAFGQSECTGPHTLSTKDAWKIGSVGRPLQVTNLLCFLFTGCTRAFHAYLTPC